MRGQFNSRVEMVAGTVDLGQVRPAAQPAGGPLKLVYATSRLDDSLGQIFLPALRRLMEEEGPRIETHFWGPQPPAELPAARHHAVIHNYDRFLRRFSAAGFEIGLAPMADDIFHRSKTNTKFREYGACRIAGVYSDVEVYTACVRQGETGLLAANNAESWHRALRQLVDDAPLRRKIQGQARAEVEERYSQEIFEAALCAHRATAGEPVAAAVFTDRSAARPAAAAARRPPRRPGSASDRASPPQRLGAVLEHPPLDGLQRPEHGPAAMAAAELLKTQ